MNAQQSESQAALREPSDEHPSKYGLLKYLMRPSNGEAANQMRGHVEKCSHCQDRLMILHEQKASFPVEQPMAHLLDNLREPGQRAPGRLSGWIRYSLLAFPVVVVAAVALLLVLGEPSRDEKRVVITDTRANRRGFVLKGTSVTWVVKRGEVQTIASPSFSFRAGDRIGFRVVSPTKAWATLLSISIDGEVRILLPQGNETPPLIFAKEATILPLSLLLESPVEAERLFVVLSPNQLALHDIQKAAEAQFRKLGEAGKGIDEMVNLPVDGFVDTRLLGSEK